MLFEKTLFECRRLISEKASVCVIDGARVVPVIWRMNENLEAREEFIGAFWKITRLHQLSHLMLAGVKRSWLGQTEQG
jgi:hypothetical protein